MAASDHTPDNPQRSPTLLIIIIVIIVVGIAAFLVLRPRGTGASNRDNPAAPAASRH